MEIKLFYKKSQAEIVALLRDFINTDFFSQYPEFQGELSFIITGSVPSGFYDAFSDMDVEFIFEKQELRVRLKDTLKQYKKSLRARNLPIQFHTSKTYLEIKDTHLSDWNLDDSFREFKGALIVLDPQNKYAKLQKQIKWYPKSILKEKICSLYGEAVHDFYERFHIARKRNDDFYANIIKFLILRQLGNAILLMHEKYPAFAKHLCSELSSIESPVSKKFLLHLRDLTKSKNTASDLHAIEKALKLVETEMIKLGYTKKESKEYWVLFRSKYKVQMV